MRFITELIGLSNTINFYISFTPRNQVFTKFLHRFRYSSFIKTMLKSLKGDE